MAIEKLDDVEPILETVNPEVFDLVSADYLVKHRQRLQSSHVPFFRVTGRQAGRYQVVPADWALVQRADLARDNQEFALARQWSMAGPHQGNAEDSFALRWNALMEMSALERVQELAKERRDFEASLAQASPVERADLILGITESAFLVNRASMSLNQKGLAAEEVDLIRETTEIIKTVVVLLAESELALTLFQTLKRLSSGHTLDHIVRVFSLMVGFLQFYNQRHSQGLNQKLRAAFARTYLDEYRELLPGLSDSQLTFDNVVRLPAFSIAMIQSYALGALMHDVGKIMDLGYFEGDAGYDATRIKQHPIVGSGLFLKAYGNKFEEARAIVGNHHHYLNHRDGYGVVRWEEAKQGRSPQPLQCAVADDLTLFLQGRALAFLPVEMCAVVDVYDALTDPSRKYRREMTPAGAVQFLHDKFRLSRKLDPIVFDLFVDYLVAQGEELPSERIRVLGRPAKNPGSVE